ncbi:DUF2059 domain-containing protein [Methylobacterium sp. E-041]|uniref:DUF2059 domain-containing protein n=3 Tax=Methylobacterium TaxID=407 RepID=UPI0011CB2228|nr:MULTISPECIES: DUF2059 domain-containing protein [unclassified Methylobacterium]MCJ2008626.1 DUF2059 domain-containing protein [Methylobacterium sp. J-092]MCJ2038018.1 DUF2059 domain-containing protein [Methylobacterium sp. J-059]MCJ2104797.1 DUF2059 domain-containing protein [Methylobacterium sp. E-041]MCJ2113129.1 DUF2059 domain-containing protein [Methylobacterium sp. E-025]TXN40905.1 DUF2059 domain-containing protein [Methylobacterium sp. WL93]
MPGMPVLSRRLFPVLVAALVAAAPGLAQAQKAAPQKPAATPAAPAAPATRGAPTIGANHLALAREVMLNSGIARSFDSIIPAFAEQIKQQTVTRPELSKDLDEVLQGLNPEMELQKQRIIDTAARIYANKLSEAELQDIAAFFRSPAGKRYVETQPQILDEMVQAMQTWTQEVSEYVMVRVRAEMGKRGHQLQ